MRARLGRRRTSKRPAISGCGSSRPVGWFSDDCLVSTGPVLYAHPVMAVQGHMRFKVYLLRQRGRRLPWREAKNGPVYVGTLVTHMEERGGERYKVTQLQPDAGPMSQERPPDLYEAQVIGFAPIAFRLRGFERLDGPDGGCSVLQEWHVEEP